MTAEQIPTIQDVEAAIDRVSDLHDGRQRALEALSGLLIVNWRLVGRLAVISATVLGSQIRLRQGRRQLRALSRERGDAIDALDLAETDPTPVAESVRSVNADHTYGCRCNRCIGVPPGRFPSEEVWLSGEPRPASYDR